MDESTVQTSKNRARAPLGCTSSRPGLARLEDVRAVGRPVNVVAHAPLPASCSNRARTATPTLCEGSALRRQCRLRPAGLKNGQAAAIGRLAPDGVAVSFGATTPEPVAYPTLALAGDAPGAQIRGLFVPHELTRGQDAAADLARLGRFVADGRLDASVDLVASWRQPGDAMRAVLDRRVAGKAVLLVD